MSNGYSGMPPPPGVVNVSSLSVSRNSTAVKSSVTTAKPTKRRSRFSDAPPPNLQNINVKIPPPPKVISIPVVKDAITAQPPADNQSASEKAAAAAARINANLMAQGKMKTVSKTAVTMIDDRNDPVTKLCQTLVLGFCAAHGSLLTSQSTAPTANISSAASTTPPMITPEIKRVDDMCVAEVVINDIPLGCRNYLTRLTTQENINKSCRAYVSTRGKFMMPEDKKLNEQQGNPEKPLYLFVQSQDEENVRKALERIKQSINNHYQKKSQYLNAALQQSNVTDKKDPSQLVQQMHVYPPMPQMMSTMPAVQGFANPYCSVPAAPAAPLPHFQPTLPVGNYVQEKLFIRIENVPETYDLKGKLLGPCYRNFTFISNQTGAKVILRGRDSGFIEPTSGREAFEAMHAFISHPNQAGVEAAKKLVLNLVETLRKEVNNLRNNAGMTLVGYSTSQSNYVTNTPPVMPTINPMTGSAVSAYPIMTPPQYASEITNNSKRKFEEADHDDSNVLGYQHNFTGTASNSSNSGSSAEDSSKLRDKSRKKRFTEESSMPPPPLPPMGDKGFNRKLKSQAVSTEEDETKATTETRSEDKQDPFKAPSLPFWMAP